MTKRCPITYETISSDQKYSMNGLKKISPKLTHLDDFPYDAKQQRQQALFRVNKLSIQGVQPKFSTRLSLKNQSFEIVDKNGSYIFKPQSEMYQELPENEDLTMRLASEIGIEVPLHGLVYSKDNSLCYFIKRFDRHSKNKKYAVEDFTQLAGLTRDTKYDFSMEKLAALIEKYCTYPLIEKQKLFRLTIFNYLIGNEDMHLKNFSVIERKKVELTPAYDLINTTIAMGGAHKEIALYLNGKKSNLNKQDFISYFGTKRLGLTETIINKTLSEIIQKKAVWEDLIQASFLSDESKLAYSQLLNKRRQKLF